MSAKADEGRGEVDAHIVPNHSPHLHFSSESQHPTQLLIMLNVQPSVRLRRLSRERSSNQADLAQ